MHKQQAYTEATLLQQLSQGSEQAFAELFALYKHRLFGFMYKLTDSAELAEDVVQEVFLKLWQNRAALSGVENAGGYIFRMAQNQAVTAFRKMARETLVLAELKDTVAKPIVNAEDALAARELETKVRQVIESLPPQQKLVYTLSREHGLKYDEIAEKLQISPGTVKNHMIQALRTLRSALFKDPGNAALLLCFLAAGTSFAK
ncbi:RNA polymerase sigma factor [Parasegetibacter sp. NRK P23]|uniref:RNA polymerase sigma factor n=1 Tax=Parasegetibacter sp. NRK P23 TaxID=2942999 RepID=UPI0020434D39|nr:RNA polymerase sigma-70 factor [Parasegetibacter sp. NRK P23]MCM5527122.1 RNA polymerase sigma-70 factor [Parasegetibacter sp. NRK P23]